MASPFFNNRGLNHPVSQLLQEFISSSLNEISGKDFYPALNLEETDSEYAAHLSVPGFRKEDIDIQLEERKLMLSSIETSNEGSSNNFKPKAFKRVINLPENADLESISAGYNQGILTIIIQKLQPKVVPGKKIIIS